MKEILPINLEILKFARESRGLAIEDVARRMKKNSRIIIEWEEGISSPTYIQLEKLASEIYKRPVAFFFFPEIPPEPNPRTEFRTLPESEIESLPPGIIGLFRKAVSFQLSLEELYEGEMPVKGSLLNKFSLDDSEDFEHFAYGLREFLDIPIEQQFEWGSYDLAFKKWRSALEDKGIFVFKDAFKNEDYSGFCIHHDKYPIIYVNNGMPFTRQIFTLFHELGHLMMKSGGVDFRDNSATKRFKGRYAKYEYTCNWFANVFLVPPSQFDKEDLVASESQWKRLAKKYKVSREVILRNFLDRKLISQKTYRENASRWIKEASAGRGSGGQYYYNQISYLGETFLNLAFKKYHRGRISLDHLSEILNVKAKNIPDLEDYAFNK